MKLTRQMLSILFNAAAVGLARASQWAERFAARLAPKINP
jgi:hypothetical protein